ncbi:hypothetical protein SDC9_163073 [bioreactor metagenome]|uniref:Uncharacterized protein n=1 Tax=bioreactor metagenome TaxID=1076179 RepID=A0A645FMT6_9ZZZZ|nr:MULTISPECIES: hypothetical protein [unclassified Clostridium]KGK90835.1 hypothetical protein DP68_01245 [Clostridium sp. HMP27]
MGEKKCINPNQLLIWASFISIIIAENLTSFEQQLVGSILSLIGENILFIQELNEEAEESNEETDGEGSNNYDNIKELQRQIDELKEYIKCLERRFDE